MEIIVMMKLWLWQQTAEKNREMKELCIKWVFPLKHDGRQVLHSHWTMLSMMYDAFPDMVVPVKIAHIGASFHQPCSTRIHNEPMEHTSDP